MIIAFIWSLLIKVQYLLKFKTGIHNKSAFYIPPAITENELIEENEKE